MKSKRGARRLIRNIAETDSIKDDITKIKKQLKENKAYPESQTIRAVATQIAGTLLDSGVIGNNGGGYADVGATNPDGETVLPPLAPPPPPKPGAPNNSTSGGSGGDSYQNYLNNNNIGGGGSSNFGSDDLSGKGNEQGDKTGSAEQADPSDVAEINTIRSAAINAGWTEEEIANLLKRLYSERAGSEKGKHEIGQVYEGFEGPKPSETSKFSTTNIEVIDLDKEVLNAVVGTDPDNEDMAIEVRFDGQYTGPSERETDAADQDRWADPNTPPVVRRFTLGVYWQLDGLAEVFYGATPQGACLAAIPYMDANPAGGASGPHSLIELEPNPTGDPDPIADPDRYNAHFDRAVGGPFTLVVTSFLCEGSGQPGDICPLVPPTEGSWPRQVACYLLTLINGKFLYSLYDPNVPTKYKSLTSTVDVKSQVTGETYRIEPAINGGFMISNVSNPDYILIYGSDRTLRHPIPNSWYNFYKPR